MTPVAESRPLSLVDLALGLALAVHGGWQDKAGQPYILHVLRVMARMPTEQSRLVAILHDVVEDSAITTDDLLERGFPPAVVAAVGLLTKAEGTDYLDYIREVKSDPLATAVKVADLEDNMDIRRLSSPTEADVQRILKYRAAWSILQEPAQDAD